MDLSEIKSFSLKRNPPFLTNIQEYFSNIFHFIKPDSNGKLIVYQNV